MATELPGVVDGLSTRLGDALEMVPLPEMESVDRPRPAGLPEFTRRLAAALGRALDAGPTEVDTSSFTWGGVFQRVEAVWKTLT